MILPYQSLSFVEFHSVGCYVLYMWPGFGLFVSVETEEYKAEALNRAGQGLTRQTQLP